jgi:hypothetical protein
MRLFFIQIRDMMFCEFSNCCMFSGFSNCLVSVCNRYCNLVFASGAGMGVNTHVSAPDLVIEFGIFPLT